MYKAQLIWMQTSNAFQIWYATTKPIQQPFCSIKSNPLSARIRLVSFSCLLELQLTYNSNLGRNQQQARSYFDNLNQAVNQVRPVVWMDSFYVAKAYNNIAGCTWALSIFTRGPVFQKGFDLHRKSANRTYPIMCSRIWVLRFFAHGGCRKKGFKTSTMRLNCTICIATIWENWMCRLH